MTIETRLFEAGQKVGDYLIVELMNDDTFVETYLAKAPDGSLLKINGIKNFSEFDELLKARCKSVLEEWKRVQHPNIEAVATICFDSDSGWFATACIAKTTLEKAVKEAGKFKQKTFFRFARELKEVLTCLISQQFSLGPILPSSVFVNDGVPVFNNPVSGICASREGKEKNADGAGQQLINPNLDGSSGSIESEAIYLYSALLHYALTGSTPMLSKDNSYKSIPGVPARVSDTIISGLQTGAQSGANLDDIWLQISGKRKMAEVQQPQPEAQPQPLPSEPGENVSQKEDTGIAQDTSEDNTSSEEVSIAADGAVAEEYSEEEPEQLASQVPESEITQNNIKKDELQKEFRKISEEEEHKVKEEVVKGTYFGKMFSLMTLALGFAVVYLFNVYNYGNLGGVLYTILIGLPLFTGIISRSFAVALTSFFAYPFAGMSAILSLSALMFSNVGDFHEDRLLGYAFLVLFAPALVLLTVLLWAHSQKKRKGYEGSFKLRNGIKEMVSESDAGKLTFILLGFYQIIIMALMFKLVVYLR